MTDRVTRRKPLASIGYLVTAVGIAAIALCTSWTQVLACRVAAWIARGSRSAPRDVLMAQATTPSTTGKAFGMERAGDALGAVIGPLVAVALLARGIEARHVLVVSLLPGLLAFLSITLLVHETPAVRRSERTRAFVGSLRETGTPFHRYLVAILLFGSGDFSRTLLILYATQHLTGGLFSWKAGTLAIALYVLHNAVLTGGVSDRRPDGSHRPPACAHRRLPLRRGDDRGVRAGPGDPSGAHDPLRVLRNVHRLRRSRRESLCRQTSSRSRPRHGARSARSGQRHRRLRLQRPRRHAVGRLPRVAGHRLPRRGDASAGRHLALLRATGSAELHPRGE